MKIQFIEVPEIYGNVCGEKILIQSKCDKNSGKGRENMKNKGKTVFFISPSVTKIP